MSEKTVQQLPIVITLTLPESSSDSHDGALLVQRGDRAREHHFTYVRIADLAEVIADALIAFAAVEADPPMIADAPSSAPPPAVNVLMTMLFRNLFLTVSLKCERRGFSLLVSQT